MNILNLTAIVYEIYLYRSVLVIMCTMTFAHSITPSNRGTDPPLAPDLD